MTTETTPTGYRVADASRRTGFPPATLRYYDDIGLVPASGRTDAGYRSYSDEDLERLRFVARAKDLGCSLAEIGDLLEAWDDECGDVRARLHHLVAGKIVETQRRITELVALASQLQVAATLIDSADDVTGPCGPECGCSAMAAEVPAGSERSQNDSVPVPLGRIDGPTPIVCTLEPGAVGGRVEEWQAVLAHVARRTSIDGGIRLELADTAPIEEVARLARAEHGCCSWMSYALTVDERGVGLEVRSPDEGADVIAAVFGVGE